MKYRITCALFFLCFAFAHSQSKKDSLFNLQLRDISIGKLIDTLSLIYDVKFSYDVDVVPVDSVVTIDIQQSSVVDLLENVLISKRIDVLLYRNQVIIRRDLLLHDLSSKSYFQFKGVVNDEQSGEPLPYVHIGFNKEPIGTVTNEMGEFRLVVPFSLANDSIMISTIGYQSIKLCMQVVDTSINVNMKRVAVQLSEVDVTAISPDNILEKVVDNKVHNYLDTTVSLTAFYRESVMQDGRYVQVLESVLDVNKPSYLTPSVMEKVRFVKGRKRDDVDSMRSILFRLQGGPYLFSRIDIARYLDFFPNIENDIYRYSYEGVSYLNDECIFNVAFEPYVDDGNLLYKGMFYINAESYALVKAEFEMTKNTLKKSREFLIRKDKRNSRAKPYFAKYSVDYRLYSGRWILNKVIGEIKIKVIDKQRRLRSDFFAKSELLVTDVQIPNRILNKEIFKPDYVLYDKVEEGEKDIFWLLYNIIKPSDDLEKMFFIEKNKLLSK
ncbi:MAG: carboxypeptidase-like regulatory domain-containing protein [Marinilabiliaceae bacterium]|nr:carboxypeptidase-like regulatory domain-containing protein [Marinilabiliaceae bacterium]